MRSHMLCRHSVHSLLHKPKCKCASYLRCYNLNTWRTKTLELTVCAEKATFPVHTFACLPLHSATCLVHICSSCTHAQMQGAQGFLPLYGANRVLNRDTRAHFLSQNNKVHNSCILRLVLCTQPRPSVTASPLVITQAPMQGTRISCNCTRLEFCNAEAPELTPCAK